MYVDLFFFQAYMNVQDLNFLSYLVAIDVSLPKSFHLPLSLKHYSLYPDVFDESATPTISLNPLDLYHASP